MYSYLNNVEILSELIFIIALWLVWHFLRIISLKVVIMPFMGLIVAAVNWLFHHLISCFIACFINSFLINLLWFYSHSFSSTFFLCPNYSFFNIPHASFVSPFLLFTHRIYFVLYLLFILFICSSVSPLDNSLLWFLYSPFRPLSFHFAPSHALAPLVNISSFIPQSAVAAPWGCPTEESLTNTSPPPPTTKGMSTPTTEGIFICFLNSFSFLFQFLFLANYLLLIKGLYSYLFPSLINSFSFLFLVYS